MFARLLISLILIALVFLGIGCRSMGTMSPEAPTSILLVTSTESHPTPTHTVTLPPIDMSKQPIEDVEITLSPGITSSPTPIPYQVISNIPYVDGGDADQVLYIYLPEEEIRKKLVLLALGGPNISFLRHFAKLGFAGLEVHYSEGTMQRGIQNAICSRSWAHAYGESYGFDPQKTIVVGTSLYGGQAGILGVIDDPQPYVEGCPHPLPEGELLSGVITLAGSMDLVEREVIDRDDPPFLLVHGTGDDMIEYQHSENFAVALENAGVDVELVLLPDVSHSGIMSNAGTLSAMEEFLSRFVE